MSVFGTRKNNIKIVVAIAGIEPASPLRRCVLSAVCLPISPYRRCFKVVGTVEIESTLHFWNWVLNPARLPITPYPLYILVPEAGIEPASPFGHRLLRPARLPISSLWLICLVGMMGIEPIRSFEHWHLKPARLPIPSQPRLFKRLSPHR